MRRLTLVARSARHTFAATLAAGALFTVLPTAQAAPAAAGPQVAWLNAAVDADVERAFAQAKAE
ncbi:MAG: hypothetical protein CFE45_20185, partial [Burkholderiales bacterium PBB5]